VYLKQWWSASASIWIARGDSRDPHRLITSSYPWVIAFARLSPNGKLVDYFQGSVLANAGARAMVIPARGGSPRLLARNASVLIWSPNSRTVAAIIHTGARPDQLVAIDVTTGKQRVLARAPCLETPEFSPNGQDLVYGAGPIPARGICHDDLYTVAVSGGPVVRLSTDHHSSWPVWGPRFIAFSRWLDTSGKNEYPSLQGLYLIRPSGGQARELIAPAQSAPRAVAWSIDGMRLVVNTGQGAATVSPATGKLRALGRAGARVFAIALSRDGSTILGTLAVSSAYDGVNVVTVPYRGGPVRTLVTKASDPSWDR
jgi:Tol biopolymer transport system component